VQARNSSWLGGWSFRKLPHTQPRWVWHTARTRPAVYELNLSCDSGRLVVAGGRPFFHQAAHGGWCTCTFEPGSRAIVARIFRSSWAAPDGQERRPFFRAGAGRPAYSPGGCRVSSLLEAASAGGSVCRRRVARHRNWSRREVSGDSHSSNLEPRTALVLSEDDFAKRAEPGRDSILTHCGQQFDYENRCRLAEGGFERRA